MQLPGITPKNQNEVVEQALNNSEKISTEKIKLPGIEHLHTKSTDEIATVLANVIKSKAGMISMNFIVGSHIEITYNDNPFNQVR